MINPVWWARHQDAGWIPYAACQQNVHFCSRTPPHNKGVCASRSPLESYNKLHNWSGSPVVSWVTNTRDPCRAGSEGNSKRMASPETLTESVFWKMSRLCILAVWLVETAVSTNQMPNIHARCGSDVPHPRGNHAPQTGCDGIFGVRQEKPRDPWSANMNM